ncbi:conserved hypothetical protein [Talaromyces stipitatus ATCC 10500]|uniref:Nucleotide-diphospho-sugar transferase domain-containing protein n=1 Tax=Talaromyces stipitatus (strain ATCC 10500 / CBS 375.48 / QM 6759 / NRRL 1006) TaxID=441959 RepID=B8ML35_TALSN|nr:uncharacterized protein TSTA_048910 [Talaromyces stipitatus ATCC 10500]EED15451.1 conserved hypothetical protein [Talaromyces stipitatus ATCC 10500]
MNAPFIHPITAPYFSTYEGYNFTLKNDPIWTKPLGKDLCVVDIDNRPFSKKHELFNEQPLNWDSFDKFSAGLLNHYLYAMIHGYRYAFVHLAQKPSDRYMSWAKVPAVIEHLKECKYLLNVEADAIFKELTLPMEWQMNYWNFTKNTKVAIPSDPNEDFNLDWEGKVNLNTGFILAQNTPRTFEIWEGWKSCVDDHVRFPGCEKFRDNWPAEQGAYSSIIRHAYNDPDDLLVIRCSEANEYPESGSDCIGSLNYQHFWIKKEQLLKDKAVVPMMQLMMQSLRLDLLIGKNEVLVKKQGFYI